jgi:hypothetical protein
MKFLLLIILPLFMFSCKKKLTEFYIDYTSEATIPAAVPLSSPFNIWTPEQTTNSEFEFEVNNTNKERIRSIILKDLDLKITSPNNQTFGFLKDIDLYISAEGLSEKLLAYRYEISEDAGKEISCTVTNKDFQEYIKKDVFSIKIKTVTRELITNDVKLDIYTNFLVDAQLFK